jgi:hypothetical protein
MHIPKLQFASDQQRGDVAAEHLVEDPWILCVMESSREGPRWYPSDTGLECRPVLRGTPNADAIKRFMTGRSRKGDTSITAALINGATRAGAIATIARSTRLGWRAKNTYATAPPKGKTHQVGPSAAGLRNDELGDAIGSVGQRPPGMLAAVTVSG